VFPCAHRPFAAAAVFREATETLQRINTNNERAESVWQAPRRTLNVCEAGRRSPLPGTIVQSFDGAAPKLAKNEDLFAAIARLVRRTRELRADIAARGGSVSQ
jgi:hypothetical protein